MHSNPSMLVGEIMFAMVSSSVSNLANGLELVERLTKLM